MSCDLQSVPVRSPSGLQRHSLLIENENENNEVLNDIIQIRGGALTGSIAENDQHAPLNVLRVQRIVDVNGHLSP